MKFNSYFFFCLTAVLLCCGYSDEFDGKLYILSHPRSVEFRASTKPIKASEISVIPLALFGIPLNNDMRWDGLLESSLFCRPKAVILVSIAGSLGSPALLAPIKNQYDIIQDTTGIDSEMISNNLEAIDWTKKSLTIHQATDNQMVDVTSSYPEMILSSSVSTLVEEMRKNSDWTQKFGMERFGKLEDSDWTLPAEIYQTYLLTNRLTEKRNLTKINAPNFVHIELSGLQKLAEKYGRYSKSFADAQRLVKLVLQQLSADVATLYDGNAVVVVAELASVGVSRQKRETVVKTSEQAMNKNMMNLAAVQSEDYPAIFNIILWLCIALALALLWITWGIWNMDPGRDSVIYRMTSQRAKRD